MRATIPSLWFVVPVHGRLDLAAICLRQLRHTCDALREELELEATAVVIADAANMRALRRRLPGLCGFGRIERDNRWLSRRFNDGIQLACDRRHNPRPADFVVPCGSDDWIDWRIFRTLPQRARQVVGFQRMSFVREDGREIAASRVAYVGGCGIRIYTRGLVERLGYRPADEDRARGCDTSILTNLQRVSQNRLEIIHADIHDRQIVDWKSPEDQLNSYVDVSRWTSETSLDPFEELAGIYPEDSLEAMRAHYARTSSRSLQTV